MFPNSMSISQSEFHISFVSTAICPYILSMSLRHAIHILSRVEISISELLFALTMFQSIFKLTDIKIAICFLMRSISIGKSTPPCPFEILVDVLSKRLSLTQIVPKKCSISMFFICTEFTYEYVTVCIQLNSIAMFFVVWKPTLVDPTIFIN